MTNFNGVIMFLLFFLSECGRPTGSAT